MILLQTSNIKILSNYLKRKIEKNYEILSKEYEVWRSLVEMTLVVI